MVIIPPEVRGATAFLKPELGPGSGGPVRGGHGRGGPGHGGPCGGASLAPELVGATVGLVPELVGAALRLAEADEACLVLELVVGRPGPGAVPCRRPDRRILIGFWFWILDVLIHFHFGK